MRGIYRNLALGATTVKDYMRGIYRNLALGATTLALILTGRCGPVNKGVKIDLNGDNIPDRAWVEDNSLYRQLGEENGRFDDPARIYGFGHLPSHILGKVNYNDREGLILGTPGGFGPDSENGEEYVLLVVDNQGGDGLGVPAIWATPITKERAESMDYEPLS